MPRLQTFRALAHRNYRLFFFGQGLSLIGTWLQQVAMSWLTYRLSGSALLLGFVTFCQYIAVLFIAPVAGVLADRVDRRRALLITQSVMLAQAATLAVLSATGVVAVWHVAALALVLGCASAFDIPLRHAMIARLVEHRSELPNAIALNSLLINCARVVGPGAGGRADRGGRRGALLRPERAVVRRGADRACDDAMASELRRRRRGTRLAAQLARRGAQCIRIRADPRRAAADRGDQRHDRDLFDADAGVRQGCVRRRGAHAGHPAVVGGNRARCCRRFIWRAGIRREVSIG